MWASYSLVITLGCQPRNLSSNLSAHTKNIMNTQQDLQEMARVAVSAKQAGDPRYQALVMALSNRLKMHPGQVEQNIFLLMMGHPL
jgi:hypothetical protein